MQALVVSAPPTLHALLPYLKTATLLSQKSPLVAHKCKLYAMHLGLKLANNEQSSVAFLKELMTELEHDRAELGAYPEENAKIQMESMATSLCLTAFEEERSGRPTRETVKKLRIATTLMEALTLFGELSEDLNQQYNQAKSVASSIFRALDGRSLRDDMSISTVNTAESSPSPPEAHAAYSPSKFVSAPIHNVPNISMYASVPVNTNRPTRDLNGNTTTNINGGGYTNGSGSIFATTKITTTASKIAASPPQSPNQMMMANANRQQQQQQQQQATLSRNGSAERMKYASEQQPQFQRNGSTSSDRSKSNSEGGGGGGGSGGFGDKAMEMIVKECRDTKELLEREREERQKDLEALEKAKAELARQKEMFELQKAELNEVKHDAMLLRCFAALAEKNHLQPMADDPHKLVSDKLKVYTDRPLDVQGEMSVFEAEWGSKDVIRAVVKVVRRNRIPEEFFTDLLETYDHPNVVRYFHYEEFQDILGSFFLLVSERGDLSLGTLEGARFVQGLRPPPRAALSRDALAGLEYIHRRSRLHGSIKPSNVILHVNTSLRPVAKLGDMGIGSGGIIPGHAAAAGGGSGTINVVGAVGRGWMAPETLVGANDNAAADVFSMGLVISFILTGGTPPLVSDNELTFQGLGVDLNDLVACGCWSAVDLLASMCSWNPADRPDAARALHHPFFWSPVQQIDFVALVGHIQRKPDDPQRSEDMQLFQEELEHSVDEYLGGKYDDDSSKRWSELLKKNRELPRGGWDKTGVETPTSTEDRYHKIEHRGLGLLRFIRNLWSRRAILIKAGHFPSENAVAEYITLPLPWLVVEVFRLVKGTGLSNLQSIRPYFDGTALPSLEDLSKLIDEDEPAATKASDSSPFKSFSRPSVTPGDLPVMLDRAKWVADNFETKCCLCDAVFGGFTRRHHCRLCGHLFCGNCAARTLLMRTPEGDKKQRVCNVCATSALGSRNNATSS